MKKTAEQAIAQVESIVLLCDPIMLDESETDERSLLASSIASKAEEIGSSIGEKDPNRVSDDELRELKELESQIMNLIGI